MGTRFGLSGSGFGKDIVHKRLMSYAKDGFLHWLDVAAPAIVDVISLSMVEELQKAGEAPEV